VEQTNYFIFIWNIQIINTSKWIILTGAETAAGAEERSGGVA
jgi:hypothetical protein